MCLESPTEGQQESVMLARLRAERDDNKWDDEEAGDAFCTTHTCGRFLPRHTAPDRAIADVRHFFILNILAGGLSKHELEGWRWHELAHPQGLGRMGEKWLFPGCVDVAPEQGELRAVAKESTAAIFREAEMPPEDDGGAGRCDLELADNGVDADASNGAPPVASDAAPPVDDGGVAIVGSPRLPGEGGRAVIGVAPFEVRV
eukprot:jgi/Mesvir1/22104/Mv18709-RA.1